MRFLLIISLLGACQSAPHHATPVSVPAISSPPAAAAPAAAARPSSGAYEFFAQDVEIEGGETYLDGRAMELGAGVALVGSSVKPPWGILHLDTFEIVAVPAFIGKPEGRVTFTSAAERGVIVASFRDEKENVLRMQVLRLDAMRWEEAGRFDIPKSRAVHAEEARMSRIWLRMSDGELRLDLTDEVDTHVSYVLDFDTLVWRKTPTKQTDHGPCLMSSKNPDDDLVRWGIAKRLDSEVGGPCVAVRARVGDPWRRIEDPNDDLIFMRSTHRIDATRVLVTGGFTFALFPFVNRADVIDVVSGEVRPLGKQAVGWKLEVPGEPFLWMVKDRIVRFDPETEQFTESPGPALDFEPRWKTRVDERTLLFAGWDENKEPHYVIAGFRPVP